jgi:hypothetical protein
MVESLSEVLPRPSSNGSQYIVHGSVSWCLLLAPVVYSELNLRRSENRSTSLSEVSVIVVEI